MNTPIKYCTLPECGKPFTNWRSQCCCKSHQGKYSAKLRHGTLGEENKSKEYLKALAKNRKEYKKTFVGPILPGVYKKSVVVVSSPKDCLSIDERKARWVAYLVNRRKRRDLSMSAWADRDAILAFYREARRLTIETGTKYEVDHIIPSNHELVCGLHNEFNLQILTKEENQKKGNKFTPY